MAERTAETHPTRIMLWCPARCMSTCMLRALVNRSRTKGLMEPFSQAYYFGTERVSKRYSSEKPTENCRYVDIKEKLEKGYEEFSTIVSKDMSYSIGHDKDKMKTRMPVGFQHTFLIRHPAKSLSSFYKLTTSPELTGWNYFDPKEAGFKELRYIYEIVTEEIGQKEPVVIDMEELLQQPEAFLKLFCQKLGIAYEDSMLHWSSGNENLMPLLEGWPLGWFTTLLKTDTFHKPLSADLPDVTGLPEVVQKTIEESVPHYDFLFARRLRIDSDTGQNGSKKN